MEKFSLDIETIYANDAGTQVDCTSGKPHQPHPHAHVRTIGSMHAQENVFNISGAQLKDRVVEWVDILTDTVDKKDYLEACQISLEIKCLR